MMPRLLAGISKQECLADAKILMERVGVSHRENHKPSELSGGEQQRVAIARALINKPQLLLADEPTGNLDSSLAVKFMYLFEALNQWGTTILFATHDESLIGKFTYPVLKLRHGKVM